MTVLPMGIHVEDYTMLEGVAMGVHKCRTKLDGDHLGHKDCFIDCLFIMVIVIEIVDKTVETMHLLYKRISELK